ncbi:MAG: hypothetical protein A4E29_00164 [Methanomassiliicoccales archaeon PtaB.Bin134]|nr:MAG: hypothetical protein A4E29_00164 [Methanomassiliicoccales archaeon PtaB.Bin134]
MPIPEMLTNSVSVMTIGESSMHQTSMAISASWKLEALTSRVTKPVSRVKELTARSISV